MSVLWFFVFFPQPYVPQVIKTKQSQGMEILGIFGKSVITEAGLCKTEKKIFLLGKFHLAFSVA